MVWLFGGATGVFIASLYWLLFSTELIVRLPELRFLDMALLAAGITLTLLVRRSEGGDAAWRRNLSAGLLVIALAVVLSHAMLRLALGVDDTVLFEIARARSASVQELGLTPFRYAIGNSLRLAAFGLIWLLVAAAAVRPPIARSKQE